MTGLPFMKMHGAGNDFIVIDNRRSHYDLDDLIRLTPALCERRIGVGADGLLILASSDTHAYTMVYRNADGSDAGMCGNGGRCIAAYAIRSGVADHHRFSCHGREYEAEADDAGIRIRFPISVTIGETEDGFRIDSGTDHLVVPVAADRLTDQAWLIATGRVLRLRHNANVNFVRRDGASVHIRTYERGVEDLTLACGTGALAAATWAGLTDQPVPVISPGGVLMAGFQHDPATGTFHNLTLYGPVRFVYEGAYHL